MIHVDMDGLITDFFRASIAAHGATLDLADASYNFMAQIGFAGPDDPAFWSPLGFDFWANLPWMDDGRELFARLERIFGRQSLMICTSPARGRGSADGKLAWLEANLPGYSRRYIMTPLKHEVGAANRLLLDDKDGNVDGCLLAGQPAILIPRPWNRRRDECLAGWRFSPEDIVEEVLSLQKAWGMAWEEF